MGTDIERVGFGFRGEVARFFFLELAENRGVIGKTNEGKHAILSHFPMVKTPNSNSRFKAHPSCNHSASIITKSYRNSSLNSHAYFPPANRPVERSKLVLAVCSAVALEMRPAIRPTMRPAVRPAVPYPNQNNKQKFINNADAKLQAPQYAKW